ncbi:uncharacterized protein [Leptinotarsa decemlineata]|uniref:uncharacterized protein n=1 Tax=Leptinotarsa decemlineata TaxID=7539 RepID=UPI003D3075EF
MSEWYFSRYASGLLIIIVSFNSLGASAEPDCDESAKTIQKQIYNGGYHYRNRYETIVENISIKCSGIQLPLPPRIAQYSCDRCPRLLEISSSNISVVPSTAFSNFPFITSLRMERNHIEELLPGAFNTLHSLKEVFLRGNNIEELSPGVFNSLSELEILDLSENNLKTLGANCLAGTIHLKSLNLSSNFLVTFNESILDQNIAEIEYIDLSFNRITDISIGNIEHKIINIDLSSNRISTMNFCISELVSVNVSRNLLKSLGKISCSNTNSRLISLDMSFNNISELFSDSFINSTQLKILNFQHNNISSLPIGLFSHLSNLEDLNLANNSLEQFYHGILEGLEKLRILDISNNKFITIKRYFALSCEFKRIVYST